MIPKLQILTLNLFFFRIGFPSFGRHITGDSPCYCFISHTNTFFQLMSCFYFVRGFGQPTFMIAYMVKFGLLWELVIIPSITQHIDTIMAILQFGWTGCLEHFMIQLPKQRAWRISDFQLFYGEQRAWRISDFQLFYAAVLKTFLIGCADY